MAVYKIWVLLPSAMFIVKMLYLSNFIHMCHLVSGSVDAVTTFKMLSSCWNNILTIYRFQCFCIYVYEKYPERLHYCWFTHYGHIQQTTNWYYISDFLSDFSHKIHFHISCRLSPKVTICMKGQSLFSLKKKKKK